MSDLKTKASHYFKKHFGENFITVGSPGRVNLIGEHTDYNEGFVLPAAIDKQIVLAMGKNNQEVVRLYSMDMEEAFEIPVKASLVPGNSRWYDYILGVLDELKKGGLVPDNGFTGFDCVFTGDIPIGAGLSSSAALEGGVTYGLNELFFLNMDRTTMAKVAQRAENNFVGMQCGIMDQFASLHGKAGSVIKLDCRSLEFSRYPLVSGKVVMLLCDTMVRRELAGSEYNVRRQQCEEGVSILQKNNPEVQSLRDISMEQLEENKAQMEPVVYKRCRYVLEENDRVLNACQALMNNDLEQFGALMNASHRGLRDDYEVSCKELDMLFEAAVQCEGVFGARMMGGGFGGCTINLVESSGLDKAKQHISAFYETHTGVKPAFYAATAGDGTRLL
ncbi:galactokinase [Balneolaceae bacterium ANBcel3]|nr:galactokinase [Balneolaceae bacterium ANBcel3]